MTSETRKLNLVERLISKDEVPRLIYLHQEQTKKKTNGNFVYSIYALTDKGTKWVSLRKNRCPEDLVIDGNYIAPKKGVIYDERIIERLFVKSIIKKYQQGEIESYQFYKFTK